MALRIIAAAPIAAVLSTLAIAQPPSDAPAKAKIEGKVISTAGAPLSKTTLRLQGTPAPPSKAWPDSLAYTSESDPSGNFLFENVEPGKFRLTADRVGYVRARYSTSGANPQGLIELTPGQILKGITIQLAPQGVIKGKVLDTEGDPMKADVTAFRRIYVAGHWQFQFAQSAATAIDGSFQIGGLAVGRYYLGADELRGLLPSRDQPGRKGPEERYVNTYYPSTLEPSSAAPVNVAAGAEVRSADIRMRKERVFRIRGKAIATDTGAPAANVVLCLAPAPSEAPLILTASKFSLMPGEGGVFEFQRLLPGNYVISTQGGVMLNGTELFRDVPRFAWQRVTVSDADIDGLILRLSPSTQLSGVIRVDGVDPPLAATPVVTITAIEGRTDSAKVKDDGTFYIADVRPNIYQVAVATLPAGTYVQSIRFAGAQDVTRTPLDLTSGIGGKLEVVLSPDAADVTGMVRNGKGEPTAGVAVTLWAPVGEGASLGILRTAASGDDGAFHFQNLAPGDYRVAGWEKIESGIADIPGFRRAFESQAAAVKLDKRDHATVDVKLVKRESIDLETANFR